MLQSLMVVASIKDEKDLESVLEEKEDKDGDTQYIFQDSDSEESSSEDDFSLERSVFTISSITTRIPKGPKIPKEELGYLGSLGMKQIHGTPRLHFYLKIKTSKYDKPLKAVALMDTGSCATVLKSHFLPYTGIQSILEIKEVPEEYKEIQQQLLNVCCDSHDQFNHPAPLWKNLDFYVRLPLKRNEDINSTKATHSGMNLEDLKLARAECQATL
ncbi:polyprotein [Arachis hypogaea]|nr:polyprotein [Arachis hypogaea]